MMMTMAMAMMATTATMLLIMMMIIKNIDDAKQFNIAVKPLNVTKTPRYNLQKNH